ncbi:MAG: alpha/beta hydrolase [Alphaproteobacteria bacterium HGW-Alphaproteobacteria-16]|nr:MAG: alpha/beta hydrolase [Alphaproteobacteria bacterium HGW-Alphaproteobacteria-16]
MPLPLPRRAYVDGPFGQIHYRYLGQGKPIVLLHQAPMTSNQFDYVYPELAARGFQAIGIDMPGFGMSDGTPDVPTVQDYARVVPPVLDALDIASAAVGGHHTGALVSAEAAVRFPDRVSAVILNGPAMFDAADRAAFMTGLHQRELGLVPAPSAAHMVDIFNTRDRLAAGTVPVERLSDYVVQALVGQSPYWHGHYAAFHYEMEPTLRAITQPTLILTNTGDMIHDHAHRARALRPDFAWHALEGGGIDIVDQQPAAWADAVADFLRAL